MSDVDMCFLEIGQLAEMIRKKLISPVELTRLVLKRIEEINPQLNAFITVLGEEALESAKKLEQEIMRMECRGPLHGVPISVKDVFAMRGVRMTAGAKILRDHIPDRDATVIERLKSAGAIIVGKTNLHEFAYGVTNTNPHYGPARNPWDRSRIPGGSSGGSAAATAAGLGYGTLGTDTGGSVRIPAALCGIVGLKPTYGRVSRYGVVPLSWSLDHVGPLARSVRDVAIIFDAISGYDPLDPASRDLPAPGCAEALDGGSSKFKLGVAEEYFLERLSDQVREAFWGAIDLLRRLGSEIVKVRLPHLERNPSIMSVVALAEAAAYHEKYFPARSDDYGADVRARLELGRTILATDYIKAQRARRALSQEFAQALSGLDAIVTPTVPVTAPKIDEQMIRMGDAAYDIRSLMIRLTRPFNLTGLPAISVPCGFDAEGLPIGLQIAGKPFDEITVLRIARAYEVNTEWRLRRPTI